MCLVRRQALLSLVYGVNAWRDARASITLYPVDGAPVGTLPGFVKTAAEAGNARVIKRWVNSTSRDVDSRSSENLTALHYVARGGHNECTR